MEASLLRKMLSSLEISLSGAVDDKANGQKTLRFNYFYLGWDQDDLEYPTVTDAESLPLVTKKMQIDEAIAYLQGQKDLLMMLVVLSTKASKG
jgi:hypothetical protein